MKQRSVLQDWVMELPFMQQTVLLTAIRGPDGIRKDHPTKVLCRYLRRCILISAFEGKPILDPYEKGGGSFTGPCRQHETLAYFASPSGDKLSFRTVLRVRDLEHALELYLRTVDEIPHHFQLHLMHAAEIIGYKHSHAASRRWWASFYLAVVNDAHLHPETEEQMDKRLGDNESNWRAREEVTAL